MLSKTFLLKSSALVLFALLVGVTTSQAMKDDLGFERKARSHITANPELWGYQPYLGFGFNRFAKKNESRVPTHTEYYHNHTGIQFAFATKIDADGRIEIQTIPIIGLNEVPYNLGLDYNYQYVKKKPASSSSSGIVLGLKQFF